MISPPTAISIGAIDIDPEPYWCLPPRFWKRAKIFKGYTVYPLGAVVGLPVRKCHDSSLSVIASGHGLEGADLELATGHAYSNGHWFRHSWVVNRPDMTLLECAPVQFDAYFGVILTKRELWEFRDMLANAE